VRNIVAGPHTEQEWSCSNMRNDFKTRQIIPWLQKRDVDQYNREQECNFASLSIIKIMLLLLDLIAIITKSTLTHRHGKTRNSPENPYQNLLQDNNLLALFFLSSGQFSSKSASAKISKRSKPRSSSPQAYKTYF
jgi:hypothetical protein